MLRLLLRLCLFAGLCLGEASHADSRPRVLASFSILGDLVRAVGGEHIHLDVLVGPNQDAHIYQPRPADVAAMAKVDLVVVNGLGFEGWIDRLTEASGYEGEVLIASEGIPETLSQGELADPHAWQSVAATSRYVRNIARALEQMDPKNAHAYRAREQRYLLQLQELHSEIIAALAAIPADCRTVVTSHDAFGYFSETYGVRFVAPQGLSTESEASARDVAALIAQIRRESITAVVLENAADARLLQQIARETGVGIGGRLYADALSDPAGEAGTYLAMMRHNLNTLIKALQTKRLKEIP